MLLCSLSEKASESLVKYLIPFVLSKNKDAAVVRCPLENEISGSVFVRKEIGKPCGGKSGGRF